MDLVVRTVDPSEFVAFCRAQSVGFLHAVSDVESDAAARRPSVFWDRTWAGFDGSLIVSTLRTFPVGLSVPGGEQIPASAVTAVTTSGTHRRRGLAARMMTAELRAAQQRGEIAAVLHASEWPIYGRFGFGPATVGTTMILDARMAALRVSARGTAEMVDATTARAALPELYRAYQARMPGEITRDETFLDRTLGLVWFPSWGEQKPGFIALVRDPAGTVVGLVSYQIEERWEHSRPNLRLTVNELIAATDDAVVLLWQFLLGLDLVAEIQVDDIDVDNPLPFLLTDARHARQTDPADGLWVRLLDLPAALSARRYLRPGRVVLEVTDPLDLAGGRFCLTATETGTDCRPTTDPAELTLDIGTLGAVFLGGHRLGTLSAAGLVQAVDPNALRLADAMFRAERGPFCATGF